MPVKRNKLDDVFSKLVRERANWECENCGKSFEHDRGYLHCSHHITRKNTATRWHPLNASAHCAKCHRRFTDYPFDHMEWVTGSLGHHKLAQVRVLANTTVKWPKYLREEIYQHYKAELKRLQQLRKDGEQGYLEFERHECMTEITDD